MTRIRIIDIAKLAQVSRNGGPGDSRAFGRVKQDQGAHTKDY